MAYYNKQQEENIRLVWKERDHLRDGIQALIASAMLHDGDYIEIPYLIEALEELLDNEFQNRKDK